MNFHNKWRAFLSESQVPLTEEEIVLIAEGRVDDAKKKYPNIVRFVDRLANEDPSKNNKYLMWMTKQLNKYADSLIKTGALMPSEEEKVQDAYFAELFTHTHEIGEIVKDFHKNIQRVKNKDINSYKSLEDLEKVNSELGFSKRQKKRGEKMKALEDVEVLMENDYFVLARPHSVEAAAVLGGARDATSWCIARGQCGDNWFTKYTGEGKAFYYILSKFLDKKQDEYLNALTIDSGGNLEEIHDRDNTSISEGDFEENITVVLFAGTVPNYREAYDTWKDMETGKPTPEIIQKVVSSLVEDFGEEHGETIDDIADVDEVYDIINRIVGAVTIDITGIAEHDAQENPAGPSYKDFQEILDEYEQNLKHAYITFDEYDVGKYSWDAGMSFQLPDDLEWVDGDADDYEDEISDIFRDKADDNYVYPEEIEFDRYDESIRLSFHPTDYDEQHGVEGFKQFCENVSGYDDQYETILEEAIEEFHERGLVSSEASRARLKQFEELPKFKNFETKLEKGAIKIFTKFDLDLDGFLEAIKFHELADSEREKADWQELSTTQRAYLDRLTKNVERDIRAPDYGSNNSVIANDWIASLAMVFAKASAEAQKQMELPLQEGKKWEPLHRTPMVEFLSSNIEVSPREKITGTILFELTRKLSPELVEDTLRFISWVDRHFIDAMDVLRKSIMQTAELRGKTAKREEPQLFKVETTGEDPDGWQPGTPTPRRNPEGLDENKQITHQALFENWRRFIK